MLKRMIQITVCIVAVAALTACAGKKSSDSEANLLRVGIVNGEDKFASMEDNEAVGIEPELARRIATKAEKELQITLVRDTDALYQGLSDGSFDLVFGRIADTTGGLTDLAISRPYGRGGYYFLTKKFDYSDCLSILGAGTVGVTTAVKPVETDFPGYDIVITKEYMDVSDMAFDISSGNIAAAICTEREAFRAVNNSLQIQEALNGPRESYVALMPPKTKIKKTVDTVINDYYDELISGKYVESEVKTGTVIEGGSAVDASVENASGTSAGGE